jgi:hypothetical protein
LKKRKLLRRQNVIYVPIEGKELVSIDATLPTRLDDLKKLCTMVEHN